MQRKSVRRNSYEKNKPVKGNHTTEKRAIERHASKKKISNRGIEGKEGKEYFPAEHARDASSQTIFHSSELTCQFLRDYTGLSIFSDLRPEDIEDVTGRYKAFLGVEFEADTVKKVRVRVPEDECESGERDVYVIPLIEHKTRVDYDVAMQLLRYMAS